MKTRNGIFYDLKYSDYKINIEGTTYVFSSKLHLQKFTEKLQSNREDINKSLSNRFNVSVKLNKLADLVLYTKIEKRGFMVVTEEGKEVCQKELIICGGERTMKRSSSVQ